MTGSTQPAEWLLIIANLETHPTDLQFGIVPRVHWYCESPPSILYFTMRALQGH